jgi:hypothetical protein
MIAFIGQPLPHKQPLSIVIDSKATGEIKPSEFAPWQCSFNVEFAGQWRTDHVHVFGHGETPSDAFRNAIAGTIARLEKELAALRDFAARQEVAMLCDHAEKKGGAS